MNDKKTIVYMLSGLGLDPGIFKHLTINAEQIHHLEWINPELNESLESYVKRMAKSIKKTDDKIVLIGHSFGGVVMQEISKLIPTKQIILISSIKDKKEKSAAMNFWMRAFPLHKVATNKMITKTFKSWGPHHGYKSPEAQEVFLHAAAKHSSYYFSWATSRICEWSSNGITSPIAHIHGNKDKTFSPKKINEPVFWIEGGDHIMVFNQPKEVSAIINSILSKLNQQ